jgi:hypothetical protein
VELRPKEDKPEEQRQNADAARLGLHVLTKTKLRQEWLRGQVPQPQKYWLCYVGRATESDSLFFGKIGFGLGEFGAIGTRGTDLRKFCVKRLRAAGVAGCLGGARGT